MKAAARLVYLALLDGLDSMRPPGIDIMMLVIAALGGILAGIQPLTASYAAARIVLDPTLFTVSLFLALRGSAGLAQLVSSGLVEVYLSYPVSRRTVALALLASRIIVPAASLLAIPLIVTGILLYPVVAGDPWGYVIVYLGYLIQSLLYGTAFALIAVASKNSGVASVASITFYFAYNVVWIIGQAIGDRVPALLEVAKSIYYNYVAYRYAIARATAAPLEVTLLEATLVPLVTLALAAAFTLYIERRFEPA